MTEHSRITIELTPEMFALLRDALASGQYASEGDVVGEALLEWRGRRLPALRAEAELADLWDQGIASGPAVDGEEAFARINSRLEAHIARGGR